MGHAADGSGCEEFVPLPLATNTVVVNFEQLAANVRDRARST